MVDVPGRDGVADEPGEEIMGEPDEDGVGEGIGVLSGGFTGEGGLVLGEGWSPPNLLCPTPWNYPWTIQNFINVLIFRVKPRVCYVKGTMKKQKSIYSKFIRPAE